VRNHRPPTAGASGGFSSSSPPGVPVLLRGARLFLYSKQAPPVAVPPDLRYVPQPRVWQSVKVSCYVPQ
jgi:hypothetical protein